jgi:undecaprenyl phosphate-alpha-L-ara4N flippase subunit ArnE
MRNFGMTGDSLGQLIGFALRTPLLWLAIALYGFSTLLWMRVLARYPVGSVYPMVAIGYLLVTLGGTIFLGERVPLQGWVALTIICFGTLLLAATPWQNSN